MAGKSHTTLMFLRSGTQKFEADRQLFLAAPAHIWHSQFHRKGIKLTVVNLQVKILIYNLKYRNIEQSAS